MIVALDIIKKLMLTVFSRSYIRKFIKILIFLRVLLFKFVYTLINTIENIFKFLNHFFLIDSIIFILDPIKSLMLYLGEKSLDVKFLEIKSREVLRNLIKITSKVLTTNISIPKIKLSNNKLTEKNKTNKKRNIIIVDTQKALLKAVSPPIIQKSNPFSYFKKILLFTSGSVFSIVIFVIPLTVFVFFESLPDSSQLFQRIPNQPTKIYDRNDKLLYEIYVDKKYEPVALEKIPDFVKNSTIAIEDSEFYLHKGIRPLSIMRAAKATVLEDNLQGASTITQQLVKNLLLTPERTLIRKIKEAMLALKVEQNFTKDQILELYLNNISYGGTTWGVQSASKKYFGKNVWELDLSESSLLAGLPTAPTYYSPLNGNIELTKSRQKLVLDRMVELGYVSLEEAEKAYYKEINIIPQVENIRAPHFVMYVREELEKKFGKSYVETGGLVVKTSLDLDFHDKIQQIVSEEVVRNAYLNISNGAAVVLDPKSGEILAYVGSRDYYFEKFGSFDVLTAYRQPGSSIKPVTYALAFKNGYTPLSTIKDERVVFKNQWETYIPVNYDGRYHGTVNFRQALANSYNIPAVKLVSKLGADNMVELGREMGLTTWEKDGSYGISITLGGKEVRLLDLANVYATFARNGVNLEATPFISIKDPKGNEILEKSKEKRILSEEVSFLITNILSDSKSRIPAFGVNNFLTIPGQNVAVKTGTTDNKRDNLTLGYTPSFVVATWVGNNDNTPMNRNLASGLSGAAPMWNRIMSLTLQGRTAESYNKPENIILMTYKRCNISEYFIKGSNIPSLSCNSKKSASNKN